MSDPLQSLITEIRALRTRYGEATARAALDAHVARLAPEKRARLEALIFLGGSQMGDVSIGDVAGGDVRKGVEGAVTASGDAEITGAVVGVNQGTIQLFFGTQPPVDAKALLDSYLRTLIADHGSLRLGKLLDRDRSGRDQAVLPEIALLKVYTSLATDLLLPVGPFALGREALRKAMDTADPGEHLPEQVRLPVFAPRHGRDAGTGRAPAPPAAPRSLGDQPISAAWQAARRDLEQPLEELSGHWYRPATLINVVQASPRLVLLGSPGSGKSTGLRHLTVFIATGLLSGTKTLRLPFFCPLGPVAQELSDDPRQDVDTLMAALLHSVLGAGAFRAGLREQVQAAMVAGRAFFFFDGLDEVPGTPEPTRLGPRSRRERIADAIRAFARQVAASPVVVTCRTRPYEQDASWQLREGWAVRRLQPFTFGQVRHFITRWYAATCVREQGRYTSDEAAARAERLIALLQQPARHMLRELAATPLLLTMLVLLDYNNTRMPERRADVYEELVKLLLDRWEGVRSSDVDRRPQRLGDRLGLPHLTVDDLRPALHELAFTAHGQQVDGRGVLTGPLLRETLDTFFARKLSPERPKEVRAAAARPRELFMGLLVEESGLLLEEADETYALPHLTFEEYLAACHLAGRDSQGIELAYQQWAAEGERWREVVLLLMGRLLRQEKYDNLYGWLQRLITPRVGTRAKTALQHQRDVLLAAACYAELGGQAAFAASAHDLVRVEDDLRAGLLTLLEHPHPALTLAERLEAGTALGGLVDPRFPVDDAQWRAELGRLNREFGHPAGYFCFVPGGRYQVGGWPEQEEEAEGVVDRLKQAVQRMTARGVRLDLQPFWIARLPVTVAQYAPFVAATGDEPHAWGREGFAGLNQPVIGISWRRATAYCAWLTERLGEVLPAGYEIRLPTEAEWETAASGDGSGERRPYPWGREEPTLEHAIYSAARLGAPSPVGCCPAGVAACGALDMGGNVLEAAASDYNGYPSGAHQPQKDLTGGRVSWRGGSWAADETYVRCGARDWLRFIMGYIFGFRVVVAPRLVQMS